MAHRFSLVLTLCAGLTQFTPGVLPGRTAMAQDAAEASYRTYDQLTAALQALAAEHSDAIQLTSIGESLHMRNIWALRVALPGNVDPDNRPALLLTAMIDGDHLVGSEVAQRAVRHLLDRAAADAQSPAAKLLSRYTFYVVPRVNPDAAELYFSGLKQDAGRNLRADDADRDLLIDEDAPNDLNGDGMITMMRVYDPEKANRLADPDEKRLDIAPDAEKGQRAE